jgi:hypothetical protein
VFNRAGRNRDRGVRPVLHPARTAFRPLISPF